MADPGRLNLIVNGREYQLEPEARWLIGRSRRATLRVDDPLVSRRHAALHHAADGWRVTDLRSSNGTWRDGERVPHTTIGETPALIRLGGPDGPAFLLMSTPAAEGETPAAEPPRSTGEASSPPILTSHRMTRGMTRIGRAPDSAVVLGDLRVSREHACLWTDDEGAVLADLGSDNGTYVNGKRIRRVRLRPGDLLGIGAHQLRYRDGHLDELDTSGPAFAAAGLGVTLPGGRQLLRDVSFSLPPRTMMAIVGPSGAGKSTLLHALSGLKPAASGRVFFGGRDLYRERAELVRRVGFVPQDDILHRALTVERALEFGARLRFPADTTGEERAERIREVVAELRLTDRLDTKISRLSGGERKRASAALELLSRPSLLFLDEPTSGLDIDLDREVMEQLRGLADGGRTVVLVTHNLDHLDRCDVILVLTTGGHVAYCGSPAGVFAHFGVSTWADVYAVLKTGEPGELAAAFAKRADRDPRSLPPRYASGTPTPDPGDQPERDRASGGVRSRRRRFTRQSGTLIRRQLSVVAGDRTLLAMLTLLPAVLALLSRGAPDRGGFARIAGNNDAPQLLLIMIIGAALMGFAGTIRELVKERAIYDRECTVGLSPIAYLCSKVVFCAAVAALQGLALALLAQAGRVRPDHSLVLHVPYLEMSVVVVAMAVVSALMGLMVSAVVREEAQTMPPLVLLSMAQIVASGGVIPVADSAVLSHLSWFFPARWAFAATAATVDLPFMHPELPHDPMWDHTAAVWRWDVGGLACLAVVTTALTFALLRRRRP